jgi:hypothetical protein
MSLQVIAMGSLPFGIVRNKGTNQCFPGRLLTATWSGSPIPLHFQECAEGIPVNIQALRDATDHDCASTIRDGSQ